ncbi:MAG: DNA topoisomerase 4 subunit A, partial [Chloroflexi bacterium]|nr:DNA topoisomerase 4 subunit A [Chloroflexota bacterium]
MVTEQTAPDLPTRTLVDEMSSSYLDYAMSVIISRALPDARDGLKPVQRRILYAMDDLGMRANQPHRKSARIVGEVLGKYHPHSDQPVYDAMVRMAQDFSLRHTLVDGQGNFGSIDNDPPAAMRYTEARLSRIAEEMLADLDKNTVDFAPNFDESLNEPTVLPGRAPNLLLNGAAGIAVAMACDIPPHNLIELGGAIKTILVNDQATLDDVLQHIQGPDFPTAGSLFAGENDEHLRRMYGTGRGGFTVRAHHHLEETTTGNRLQIVFTEIPYQANKVRIIEQIAALVRDKKIEGIRDLRDESDRHGMRLVVELTRDGHVQTILAQLYKSTGLQSQYSGNFVALVDNRPRTLTLFQLLREFIRHRRTIITRRTEFDLEKARDRHHIVEGLLKAIDSIDAIIAAIRAAESAEAARDRLQEDPFDLSQRQAQAVLEMQLRRLAQLERTKLEEEYQELTETIEYLEGLLADEKKIDGLIAEDMDELVETYGEDRKSRVIERSVDNFSPADLVPHQSSVVTLTPHGYIKRQPLAAIR